MTANQTLGLLASVCDLSKVKPEVQKVEGDPRFDELKQMIREIVAQGKSSGVPEEVLRDNGLVLAMNINLEFRQAVSEHLLKAYQAGKLT
jgi:hypothetical protein